MDANKFRPAHEVEAEKEAQRAALEQREALRRQMEQEGMPQLRELKKVRLPSGRVIELEARGIGSADFWELQDKGYTKNELFDENGVAQLDEEGNPKVGLEMIKSEFMPRLIAGSFYVPGTDLRMWSNDEEDLDFIRRLDIDVSSELFMTAFELSGMSKKARERMEGNFEAAAQSDSPSSSPTA